MKELIITTVLTTVVFIITRFIHIDDKIISVLIDLVPIVIPTYYMWSIMPRNYLKIMGFKNVNIRYQIDIKIDECYLTDTHFKEVRTNLLQLDNQGKGRVLKENIGDIIMLSVLDINAGIIDMQYYYDDGTLLVKSSSNIKYKLFFKIAKDFLNQVNLLFTSNEDISYKGNNLKVRLKIEFIDDKETCSKNDTKNPLWNKLFLDFSNKVINFKYDTKRGNKVLISNDAIEFIGNDLESVSSDIKKELTLLSFMN